MKENSPQIENLYLKIFKWGETRERSIYLAAAKIAYSKKDYRLRFFKEITQQLVRCRENMTEYFGEEIIKDIDSLNLKVRKIPRPKLSIED